LPEGAETSWRISSSPGTRAINRKLSVSLALPALRSGALVAILAATLALAAPAPRAQAHPFGPPQTATVVATAGDSLQVRWKFGGSDDISYLAVALDVLPDDRVTLDGAVFFEDGDDSLVASAPAFHDYVLQHILVANDGRPCTGVVEALSELTEDGATVDYRCPTPLGTAALTIDMLNDLHPAYRTLTTGPDGQRAVYDGENTVHEWTFDTAGLPTGAVANGSAVDVATPSGSGQPPGSTNGPRPVAAPVPSAAAAGTDLGRGAAVQLAVVGGALLVIAAGITVWFRTKKRRA